MPTRRGRFLIPQRSRSHRCGAGTDMLIDIRGFNPQNLGSCLMLLAAQERLSRAFPAARISVALGTDDLRLARPHRERFGVVGRWPRRWKRLDVGWLGQVVPESLQRAFSMTRDQD